MLVYLSDGSAQTKRTRCHTEMEVADQTFYLTQSQYTDTGPTGPIGDPITPGAWRDSHWSANFSVTGMTRPDKKDPWCILESNPDLSLSRRTHLPLGHGVDKRQENVLDKPLSLRIYLISLYR